MNKITLKIDVIEQVISREGQLKAWEKRSNKIK